MEAILYLIQVHQGILAQFREQLETALHADFMDIQDMVE